MVRDGWAFMIAELQVSACGEPYDDLQRLILKFNVYLISSSFLTPAFSKVTSRTSLI